MSVEPTIIFDNDEVPCLIMGKGNLVFPVCKSTMSDKIFCGITISTVEQVDVGTLVETRGKPLMRIISDNPKSIDILIEQLKKARELL